MLDCHLSTANGGVTMVGQTVGKYRIVSRLGRGGMGTVYKAVDETLEREVAIKVLNPDLGDPEILKRFRAEAITLARLNHPNIATLYEFAQHDGDLLMVMEFVGGETFDRLSDRFGPLPFDRAASLCSQVLDALSHAHRARIVHRDLKPANLMVTDSGLVKVMDFGIARIAGTEHLTTDGYMMGTPAYMAPEQVLGNEVDGRADIYSVGVVLFRLLTANLPFKADTAIAMAQKQVKDPPTPLRQFRAELPSGCQDILDRALAKAPDERFQTADEFRVALRHAGAPIANVGSTTAVPTEPNGLSGMDVTVPPNVMITPVTGVRHVVPVSVDSFEHAPPAAVPPAPAVQQRRPPIGRASAQQLALPVAALLLIVALGIGVTWMRRQRGAAVSAPPATPASVDAGVSPTGTPAVPPATDVTLQPAVPPTSPPAAKPTSEAPRPSVVKPTRARDASKPVAAKPDATVAGAPTAPAETLAVRASSPLLPPLVFKSVDLLMVDGRKTHDRDAALRLADGAVQVLDGETRLRTAPYDSIIAIYHSHSRDPQWVTPGGTSVAIVKVEASKFRLFKGDRDWVTVRTKSEFIMLKPDSSSVRQIVSALESRTGLKVIRVGERN
jgi:serine/threonine protein kinase